MTGEYLTLGINDRNPQGAVLWGNRLNVSTNGTVKFNRLIITQPGDVNLIVTHKSPNNEPRVLGTWKLSVQSDPEKKNGVYCLFVFQSGICPLNLNNLNEELAHQPSHTHDRTVAPNNRYLDVNLRNNFF